MAIVRIYTGKDGKSHFQDIKPEFHKRGGDAAVANDQDAVIMESPRVIVRKFDPKRSNAWHAAPGRYCVINFSGAVEIEVGDGSKRTLGTGDVLIAEDTTGQGHYTREVGKEPRVSIFVPLG